jgi:hypothetical protein
VVRKFAIWSILLLLTFVLTDTAVAQTNRLGWHTNLRQAADLSAETGKPLFVVFRCER